MAPSNTTPAASDSKNFCCTICNVHLDTVESLEAHSQSHRRNSFDNLLNEINEIWEMHAKMSAQAQGNPESQEKDTPGTSTQSHTMTSYPSESQYSCAQYTHCNFSHSSSMEQASNGHHQPYVPSLPSPYVQPMNRPSLSSEYCGKCGLLCGSTVQLNEHNISVHGSANTSISDNINVSSKKIKILNDYKVVFHTKDKTTYSLVNQLPVPFDSQGASVPSTLSTNSNSTLELLESESDRKSSAMRRIKIDHCGVCDRWFTSESHLRRHYGTMLHKKSLRSKILSDCAKEVYNQPRQQYEPELDQQNQPDVCVQPDGSLQPAVPTGDSRDVVDASSQPPCAMDYFDQPQSASTVTVHASEEKGNVGNNFSFSDSMLTHQPLANTVETTTDIGEALSSAWNSLNDAGPSFSQHQSELPSFEELAANAYSRHATMPPSEFDLTSFSELGVDTPNEQQVTSAAQYQLSQIQNSERVQPPICPNGMANNSLPNFDWQADNQVLGHGTSTGPARRPLPSFDQLQAQGHNDQVPNPIFEANVGSQGLAHMYHTGEHSVSYYRPDDNNFKAYNNVVVGPVDAVIVQGDDSSKENSDTRTNSPAHPELISVNTASDLATVSFTVGAPLTQVNWDEKPAGSPLYKCYECNKIFTKACYLTQHNKSIHSGEKPFKCNRCGKRFVDEESFRLHEQKHTDDKPFKCMKCVKSFNYKSDLRRHMVLHSDSKPFTCSVCGKGFIRKDHMKKHQVVHFKKNCTNT